MLDPVVASLLGTATGVAGAVAVMFFGPTLGARAARRQSHDEALDAERRQAIVRLYGALTEVRAVLTQGVHADVDDAHVAEMAGRRITELNGALISAAIFVEDDLRKMVEQLRSRAWQAIAYANAARMHESADPNRSHDRWEKAVDREEEFETGYAEAADSIRDALVALRT